MKFIKIIVAAILLLGNSKSVSAQKNDSTLNKNRSYYVNLNIGYAGFGLAVSPGLIAQVSKKSVLGFSYQQTIKSRIIGFSSVPENVNDAWSFYYGKIIKKDWGHFLIMAGPSYVKVTEYTYLLSTFSKSPDSEKHNSSFGIALQVGVVYAYKWIGGGVNLFANINGAYTYAGITTGVTFGESKL